MSMTCTSCGSRALPGEECPVCLRIEHVFGKNSVGDAEYVLHEMAHCLVMFGKLPKAQRDFDWIDMHIDRMFPRNRQMTELRALALEMAGCKILGAASGLEDHLNPVWDGLQEIVRDQVERDGNVRSLVCTTKAEAVRVLRRTKPSPRLVSRYVNFVLRRRVEAGRSIVS